MKWPYPDVLFGPRDTSPKEDAMKRLVAKLVSYLVRVPHAEMGNVSGVSH